MVNEPAALLGEIADTLPFIAKLLTYFRAAGLPGADHKIGFESGFRLIRSSPRIRPHFVLNPPDPKAS
jgi:hypothetical protein